MSIVLALQTAPTSVGARSGDEVEDVEVVAEPHKLVVWSGRWYFIGSARRWAIRRQ